MVSKHSSNKLRQRGRLASNSSGGKDHLKKGIEAIPVAQFFLRRFINIPVLLVIVLVVVVVWIINDKQIEVSKEVNSAGPNKNKDVDKRTGDSTPTSSPKEANFLPSIHRKLIPKSITIEKKKVTFKRFKYNNSKSHVNVYIADNFLTETECDGLSAAHSHHVLNSNKKSPILCFESVDTLNKHFQDIGYNYIAGALDFTDKTTCLNVSLSQKLRARFKWSYSTAFYPGESRFSSIFEARLQEATRLPPSHGGKFQVTSYPQGIGYRNHTDCTEDSDTRDRYATVLVYLQNVHEGGETKFPDLGISVKPKKGRLLVWNNMTPDGKCDPTSVHNAAQVVKGHKFIIQRWYYYKNFYSLGKRPPEPKLPKREALQPRVSCDQYEKGSCRWYDEWGYDHLIDYNLIKHKLA